MRSKPRKLETLSIISSFFLYLTLIKYHAFFYNLSSCIAKLIDFNDTLDSDGGALKLANDQDWDE
jgi:hypothetical protein